MVVLHYFFVTLHLENRSREVKFSHKCKYLYINQEAINN